MQNLSNFLSKLDLEFNDLIEINSQINPNLLDLIFLKIDSLMRVPGNEDIIIEFLNQFSKQSFVKSLQKANKIQSSINTVFEAIKYSNYSTEILLRSRAEELKAKALFKIEDGNRFISYSYEQVYLKTQEIAASFYKLHKEGLLSSSPRVAILSENHPYSAMADLACLSKNIPVFPLNINFKKSIIEEIVREYKINVFITDNSERASVIQKIIRDNNLLGYIFLVNNDAVIDNINTFYLSEYISRIDYEEINQIISEREIPPINSVSTIMFTSGSTGRPKGIAFTDYNLISKRFARGAALPDIGNNEVMLSYLPLFHTFGRYLEMMGTIYWRGCYVFTGSTARSALFKLFPKVEPTVFISIPLRWKQIFDMASERINNEIEKDSETILKEIVGTKLKWGLSAAGYLSPQTFRFFNRNRIALCSGFGMTEATGGVTMTMPGEYIENSVGKALPGVTTHLSQEGELLIRGEYIARYDDDKKIGDIVDYNDTYDLKTGDIFKIDDNGNHFIIDRLKDIYKNNRGQTVSPKNVEDKFVDIPGIKNTFLVGDGKEYNTLLIVPDMEEEIIKKDTGLNLNDYYHKLILEANKELAPYERVINFCILDREFSIENSELTPKGSYNRRRILESFNKEIEELYSSSRKVYNIEDISISIPLWFFRDKAILETDIITSEDKLLEINSNNSLQVIRLNKYQIKIGNLVYKLNNDSNTIDLGVLAKNPYLWIGNPELIKFSPVRYAWYSKTENITDNIELPIDIDNNININAKLISNDIINEINHNILKSYYSVSKSERIDGLSYLNNKLKMSPKIDLDIKLRSLIIKKLESIAFHHDEDTRCEAYKILLLNHYARSSNNYSSLQTQDFADLNDVFNVFLKSGNSFLNERTIREISSAKFEKRKLEALRVRMFNYRNSIYFPTNEQVRAQFLSIFKLLSNFAEHNPDYYGVVRHEFSNWITFRSNGMENDTILSKLATDEFRRLSKAYEENLSLEDSSQINKLSIIYDNDISQSEIKEIDSVIKSPGFLLQSVRLSQDAPEFNINSIEENGIWCTRLKKVFDSDRYQITIKLKSGMLISLQLFLNENTGYRNIETALYHNSISGFPFGKKVLPKLGAFRAELNAKTLSYIDGLTLWQKLMEINSRRVAGNRYYEHSDLRRFFIEAMSAFWRCWEYSNRSIIPGYVSPDNVIISELDFKEGTFVMSINGWKESSNSAALISEFINNFYLRTLHFYPRFKKAGKYDGLQYSWIFDSYGEVYDEKELLNLLEELISNEAAYFHSSIREILVEHASEYLNDLSKSFFKPLALTNAIERYNNWYINNAEAMIRSRENSVIEIKRLYNLSKLPDLHQYYFYRHTIFSNASNSIKEKFDILLQEMHKHRDAKVLNFPELQDLHKSFITKPEKDLFARLMYPESSYSNTPEIIIDSVGSQKELIIKSFLQDKFGNQFAFRKPISPVEIGKVYRLFFSENFPVEINENDLFYIVFDDNERVIAGISYSILDQEYIYIAGLVVSSNYSGRGIGNAMLNDFCSRISSQSYKYVLGGLTGRDFYINNGFSMDEERGYLIRNLADGQKINILGNYCIIK